MQINTLSPGRRTDPRRLQNATSRSPVYVYWLLAHRMITGFGHGIHDHLTLSETGLDVCTVLVAVNTHDSGGNANSENMSTKSQLLSTNHERAKGDVAFEWVSRSIIA